MTSNGIILWSFARSCRPYYSERQKQQYHWFSHCLSFHPYRVSARIFNWSDQEPTSLLAFESLRESLVGSQTMLETDVPGTMEAKPADENSSAKDSTVDILTLKSTSTVVGDICQIFGVFFAIGVRLTLLAFCIFTVWLVVYRLEEPNFWTLLLLTIPMILEGINIVVTRAGQERKW